MRGCPDSSRAVIPAVSRSTGSRDASDYAHYPSSKDILMYAICIPRAAWVAINAGIGHRG
jgi:hypothetical protein